jgi:hypothetical protein
MFGAVTHDEVVALMPAYAAATLGMADAARVSAHLASGCPDCLREFIDPAVTTSRAKPSRQYVLTSPPRTRRTLALAVACVFAATGFAAWAAWVLQRRETRAARESAAASGRALETAKLAATLPADDRGPQSAKSAPPAAPSAPADAARQPGKTPAPERREATPGERGTSAEGGRTGALVTYSPEALSISVANAPLTAVLKEIAGQSGAVIRGEPSARAVGASFEDVPLGEALHRVLGEQNFTVRYGPEGELRAIDLLGEPSPLAASHAAQGDASTPDDRTKARRHGHRDVASTRSAPPDKQVRVAIAGTETDRSQGSQEAAAQLGQGIQQGATTPGESNQDYWPPPDELDRKLRRRFLDMLTKLDETALAEYFATEDGQWTQAFLAYFAENHAGEKSRQKAVDILNRIPARAAETP